MIQAMLCVHIQIDGNLLASGRSFHHVENVVIAVCWKRGSSLGTMISMVAMKFYDFTRRDIQYYVLVNMMDSQSRDISSPPMVDPAQGMLCMYTQSSPPACCYCISFQGDPSCSPHSICSLQTITVRGREFVNFHSIHPEVFMWWCYSKGFFVPGEEDAGRCPVGLRRSLVSGAITQLIRALK